MRSEARSFALQMLYQAAVYPNLTAEQIQKQYWQQSFFIDPDLYVPIHLFRRLFWTPARSQYSPQATRRHRQDQVIEIEKYWVCLLYTSPSPRDVSSSRMPSSA